MRATCRTCHAEYTGRMEHCPACHQTFTGATAGDMHRAGPGHARRCLTEAEMLDKGMGIDGRGRWKSSDEPWDTAGRFAGANLSAPQPEPDQTPTPDRAERPDPQYETDFNRWLDGISAEAREQITRDIEAAAARIARQEQP